MPRTARASAAGYGFHVLNRGNARAEVFHHSGDSEAFLDTLTEATSAGPCGSSVTASFPTTVTSCSSRIPTPISRVGCTG
jgi:hypothetical protein